MSNEIILYSASTGIQISQRCCDVSSLMEYNKLLKPSEAEKVIKAVDGQLYDMAAEYLWSRTINILKKDIFKFGNEFVAEMLDRPNGDIDTISEYEIITLSADLGFINSTAKMEFLQFSETIQHFMSLEEDEEEFPVTRLIDMVRSCIKYVLGYDSIEYEVPFGSFRDRLKSEIVNSGSDIYEQLKTSPYFYKKTITKTLLNLAKTLQEGAEREVVLANLSFIVPGIWQDLSSEDRWAIGRAYAQANNDGDENLSKALKSLLIKIKGFDYVPENLRSNSYITAAKDLLTTHQGMNNFYREPSYAKVLCDMGSSIPMPAFSICMTATLACKLGNGYGVSENAQQYLDKILDRVSPERWRYYLGNDISKDSTILYKLCYQKDTLENFKDIVDKYKLYDIRFTTEEITKVMQALAGNKLSTARKIFIDMYDKLN
ncbi:MAG: hypothetical protein K2J83_02185 [Clostridia bacterium]|nr:hypothetical protein [Clostridia bacterium]